MPISIDIVISIISHFIGEEIEALSMRMSGARWQDSIPGSLVLQPVLLITS